MLEAVNVDFCVIGTGSMENAQKNFARLVKHSGNLRNNILRGGLMSWGRRLLAAEDGHQPMCYSQSAQATNTLLTKRRHSEWATKGHRCRGLGKDIDADGLEIDPVEIWLPALLVKMLARAVADPSGDSGDAASFQHDLLCFVQRCPFCADIFNFKGKVRRTVRKRIQVSPLVAMTVIELEIADDSDKDYIDDADEDEDLSGEDVEETEDEEEESPEVDFQEDNTGRTMSDMQHDTDSEGTAVETEGEEG